jgi:hypothetical protein
VCAHGPRRELTESGRAARFVTITLKLALVAVVAVVITRFVILTVSITVPSLITALILVAVPILVTVVSAVYKIGLSHARDMVLLFSRYNKGL